MIWRYRENKINLTFKGAVGAPPHIMAGGNGVSRSCTSVLVGIGLLFSQRYCTKDLGTRFVCSVSRMRGIYLQ